MSSLDQVLMEMFLSLGLGCYPNSPYLELQLNRASVLNDTFEQLAEADQKDYKRELVVQDWKLIKHN